MISLLLILAPSVISLDGSCPKPEYVGEFSDADMSNVKNTHERCQAHYNNPDYCAIRITKKGADNFYVICKNRKEIGK